MKFILLVSLFLIINNLLSEDLLLNQFSLFKQNYNKSYPSLEEESKRFENFKKKYEKYGIVNEFSDVADYEEALKEFKKTKKLPESIDYSNILGDVKDQKECGFCYAFSFVSQVEAQFKIKYGKSYRFAEQELLDCSGGVLSCQGGNQKDMKHFLKIRNYLALEKYYGKFTGIVNKEQCNAIINSEKKYSSTIKFKVEKVDFLFNFKKEQECIKSHLVKYGPIGAAMRADAFKNYDQGIITENPYGCIINQTSNHAVTIVGYNYYLENDIKKYYWIIRNSYGKSFGINGYAKIKMGDNICGIEDDLHYIKISWDSWCREGCDDCYYDSKNKKTVCESCINGYQYNKEYKSCLKCTEGCKNCPEGLCQECDDGYVLGNNLCFKCFPDCKKCTGLRAEDCYEWYFGETADEESFIDKEINETCFCKSEPEPDPDCSKYLIRQISFIILLLFLLY